MDNVWDCCENAESELSPYLRGPLTRSSLLRALTKIRDITKAMVAGMPADARRNLANYARAYIPPKDLTHRTLTPTAVVESLVVNLLIDEHFVSLTNQPQLKAHFWNELKKDGVTFNVWSGVQRAMRG